MFLFMRTTSLAYGPDYRHIRDESTQAQSKESVVVSRLYAGKSVIKQLLLQKDKGVQQGVPALLISYSAIISSKERSTRFGVTQLFKIQALAISLSLILVCPVLAPQAVPIALAKKSEGNGVQPTIIPTPDDTSSSDASPEAKALTAIEEKLSSLTSPANPDLLLNGEGTAAFARQRGKILYELAELHMKRGDLPVAEAIYKDAISYFKTDAKHFDETVADCFGKLETVLRNEKLYVESRQLHHDQAIMVDGSLGKPPAISSPEFLDWAKTAYELGHPSAATLIGIGFLKGILSDKKVDLEKARFYLERGTGQQNGCAEVQLGIIFRDGLGVDKDIAEAQKYFTLANDYGNWYLSMGGDFNSESQLELGRVLETGNGLPVNKSRAYLWYRVASQGSGPAAQNATAELDRVKSKLNEDEKVLFEQQVTEWRDAQNLSTEPKQ